MKNLLFVLVVFSMAIFADTASFKLRTDENGAMKGTESIPAGAMTLVDFSSSTGFANIQIIADGVTTIYSGAVVAKETYQVKAVAAKKSLTFKGTGGSAKANITVNVNYKFQALTFGNEDIASRTVESFTFTTDANGAATMTDSIPTGKVTTRNFKASHSFGQSQVLLDGVVKFQRATTAGTTYSIAGTATKSVTFNVSGGPANTTITVTMEYTYSPFLFLFSGEERKGYYHSADGVTDSRGNISIKESSFEVSEATLVVRAFTSSMCFKKVTLFLDGQVVFPQAESRIVDEKEMYTINVKVAPGQHVFSIIGEGGVPFETVSFCFFCGEE